MLDGSVEELLDLGELDDLVELALDLCAPHPQDGAIQVDVLAAGQLRMKAGADLQQAADPAVQIDPAGGRLGDPRQNLQQRGLARAVAADDAHDLAWHDVETDIAQRPDVTVVPAITIASSASRQRSQYARRASNRIRDAFAQVAVGGALAKFIALAEALDSDDRFHVLLIRSPVIRPGEGRERVTVSVIPSEPKAGEATRDQRAAISVCLPPSRKSLRVDPSTPAAFAQDDICGPGKDAPHPHPGQGEGILHYLVSKTRASLISIPVDGGQGRPPYWFRRCRRTGAPSDGKHRLSRPIPPA